MREVGRKKEEGRRKRRWTWMDHKKGDERGRGKPEKNPASHPRRGGGRDKDERKTEMGQREEERRKGKEEGKAGRRRGMREGGEKKRIGGEERGKKEEGRRGERPEGTEKGREM